MKAGEERYKRVRRHAFLQLIDLRWVSQRLVKGLKVKRLTSKFHRHAVSIDERRCKFKPALLQQDKKKARAEHKEDDIKEVFFPGNHGDVGGGWPAKGNNAEDEANDPIQLSDLALEWMIMELDALSAKHPTDQIVWNNHKDIFLKNFNQKVQDAVKAPMHDILKYGGGVSYFSTLCWHLLGQLKPKSLPGMDGRADDTDNLEWLPFFKRLELINGEWKSIFFPPNMGGFRDIPENAEFHPSVKARMQTCPEYRPKNDGFTVKP